MPEQITRPKGYETALSSDAISKWLSAPARAEGNDEATISIFDVIGDDMFGEGFSEKRMGAALRSIGSRDVTVDINSPGGDVFAGLAIYNQLSAHPGKVTVRVMGLAASAASLIAMAGDEILMGRGSEMMLHRSWGLTIGNTHDASETARLLARFDEDMAGIYGTRSGQDTDDVLVILDGPDGSDGTWFSAREAIEAGFADAEMFPTDSGPTATMQETINATKRLELALASANMPRRERRSLIGEVKGGTQDAALTVMHDAGEIAAALKQLQTTINT